MEATALTQLPLCLPSKVGGAGSAAKLLVWLAVMQPHAPLPACLRCFHCLGQHVAHRLLCWYVACLVAQSAGSSAAPLPLPAAPPAASPLGPQACIPSQPGCTSHAVPATKTPRKMRQPSFMMPSARWGAAATAGVATAAAAASSCLGLLCSACRICGQVRAAVWCNC